MLASPLIANGVAVSVGSMANPMMVSMRQHGTTIQDATMSTFVHLSLDASSAYDTSSFMKFGPAAVPLATAAASVMAAERTYKPQ